MCLEKRDFGETKITRDLFLSLVFVHFRSVQDNQLAIKSTDVQYLPFAKAPPQPFRCPALPQASDPVFSSSSGLS